LLSAFEEEAGLFDCIYSLETCEKQLS